jgi:hypothetical protein
VRENVLFILHVKDPRGPFDGEPWVDADLATRGIEDTVSYQPSFLRASCWPARRRIVLLAPSFSASYLLVEP